MVFPKISAFEKFGSSSYGDFEILKVTPGSREPQASNRAGSNPGGGISPAKERFWARFGRNFGKFRDR